MQSSYSGAVNEPNFVFFNDPTNKMIANVNILCIYIVLIIFCKYNSRFFV